jgi:hypothetical protein
MIVSARQTTRLAPLNEISWLTAKVRLKQPALANKGKIFGLENNAALIIYDEINYVLRDIRFMYRKCSCITASSPFLADIPALQSPLKGRHFADYSQAVSN